MYVEMHCCVAITIEQNVILMEGLAKYGNDWMKISHYMAGAHTALQCFYRWHLRLKAVPALPTSTESTDVGSLTDETSQVKLMAP